LGDLASPGHDQGALELDVRQALELGRRRAQASAESRLKKKRANEARSAET
jgi:hypothetical protein